MEFMGPQQKSMIILIIMLCFGHIFFQAFTIFLLCYIDIKYWIQSFYHLVLFQLEQDFVFLFGTDWS